MPPSVAAHFVSHRRLPIPSPAHLKPLITSTFFQIMDITCLALQLLLWLTPHLKVCPLLLPDSKSSEPPTLILSYFLEYLWCSAAVVSVHEWLSKMLDGAGFLVPFLSQHFAIQLPHVRYNSEGVVCVGSVASREVPRSCPICHKVISNFYNLKKHITTMHQAPVHYHACAHCTAAFRTPEYLRKHLVNVHKYPVKKKK
ncbi:hypothetical protein Pcinc_030923 [Petrolisthes cinctipes]|uniref:C2H2-type domain-containing protein n=2 Tax=Petrolisthes cinctipes TaxID=88211 RepID=A0AAE1EXR1_PETCI|nr:hypothetical protein Pcinc_030923 [Petrolisthes cinctipes]